MGRRLWPRRKLFRFAIVLLLLFGAIQLVPYGRNHTDPRVVAEPKWDSPATRKLAVTACFDCHSNQTKWWWATDVAPFSWLVYRDVQKGRQILDFSEWGTPLQGGRSSDPQRIAESVLSGRMPPIQYWIAHWNAKLSSAQKQQLAKGLLASLR